MQFLSRVENKVSEFLENQSGNVLIISSLMIFVLIGVAGGTLDYGRIHNTKSKMESSLDAALLATGAEIMSGKDDADELEAYAISFFKANIEGSGGFADNYELSAFDYDEDTGRVTATASTVMEATMMRALGYDEFDLNVSASAIFDQTDVEVAMMLDVTGSMSGSKIDDLRDAASGAIDILLPNNNTKGTRIGLVPYSWSVNAGKRVARMVTKGKSNRCVTERGVEAATDASYKDAEIGADERAVGSNKCPNEIQPLTNRKNLLKREIRDIEAQGYTAGHLGIAWSYYMLSETWRNVWKSKNDPAFYSDDVQKIAILMTDGEFNTFFDGTSGNAFGPHPDPSNELAKDLCTNMKAAKAGNPGIIIYSIAFDAPASAQATLKDCATEDTASHKYYYSADDGEELREAFSSIASSIQRLRISQ